MPGSGSRNRAVRGAASNGSDGGEQGTRRMSGEKGLVDHQRGNGVAGGRDSIGMAVLKRNSEVIHKSLWDMWIAHVD